MESSRINRPLDGYRILVTGATGGVGRAVASVLARDGATLILVARHYEALRALVGELPPGGHDILALDVRDEHGWSRALERVAPTGLLHGIVTAAAILAPVGPVGKWGITEFRSTLDTNVVGTLLPILTMINPLKAARGSVVAFSGGGSTAPLPRFDAYAASKAAVVRLVENLAVELAATGVRLNAVAPGFVASPMHQTTLSAGPDLAGDSYFDRTKSALASGGDPPSLAAELTSFLLSPCAIGITGKLISARWDPWQNSQFQDRLRSEAHLGTLRRIDDQFFALLPGRSD